MINRRKFIGTTLAAAAAAHARPIFASETRGIQGANDRIRVGLIGCGTRGGQVSTDWMKHKDSVFIAACDVAKDRLEKMSASMGTTQSNKVDTYEEDPRAQGYRCSPDRHARSLAQPDDD